MSLIESNYLGFGSGVVDPETGIHYQNRGSYFSLDEGHPNVLEPAEADARARCSPGCCSGAVGSSPWIVIGSMGGDAQPQIHAQFVSAVVDGGLDIRTAIAAPRFYIEPADHFAPPTAVYLEPRHADGIDDALRALGHDLVPTAAFDSNLGHEHAIELVDGGPARTGWLAGGRDGPAQRGAAGGLVAVAHMRYSADRWQAALTHRRHRLRSPPAAPGPRWSLRGFAHAPRGALARLLALALPWNRI